jgi:crotonobetainyl-CoA:carnitine CoA-transferase CaiB-like acyl-CoA transferase
MSQPSGPLAGIKVLDLTSVLYGPYASQTLGDWGAEVIKIEPLTGDTWRYSGQFRNRGMTGQFMAVNRNKRSLGAGSQAAGRQIRIAAPDSHGGRPAHQYPSGGIGKTGLRL